MGRFAVELNRQLVEHLRLECREVAAVLGWDEHPLGAGVHGYAQLVAEAFDAAQNAWSSCRSVQFSPDHRNLSRDRTLIWRLVFIPQLKPVEHFAHQFALGGRIP